MSKQFNDLGLGSKVIRLVNRDGTFNVKRVGLGFSTVNLYQDLIKMSWVKFLILVISTLFLINILFALSYYLIGIENFTGMIPGSLTDNILQCFFFSFQTFTTVGYGHIAPRGNLLSLMASLEAMTGLMIFAIITGLLYGRFAKPSAKILFSENILISPFGDGLSLQFRIVNKRKSTIMDISARVIYSHQEKGKSRVYLPLELERSQVTLFPLNWTIVHPINEKSPLYGKTYEEISRVDTEFIIVLKGYDDTFSQDINSIHSYHYEEMIWGAKFDPMYDTNSDNIVELDFSKLSSYQKLTKD
jgi:inward rectifier potassium channel